MYATLCGNNYLVVRDKRETCVPAVADIIDVAHADVLVVSDTRTRRRESSLAFEAGEK